MMPIMLFALIHPSPLPDELAALDVIRKAVSLTKAGSPPWRLSQGAWDTTWGQEAFGIGNQNGVDTTRFRFRVPPDAERSSVGGKPPFVVEAYENGFPGYGVRRDGSFDRCRPLGIEYDARGECPSMSVWAFQGGRWREAGLSPRAKPILLRFLGLHQSRFLDSVKPTPIPSSAPVWFKVTVKGHPVYWWDENLNVTSPYGADSLPIDVKASIADILAGLYNKPASDGRNRE